MQKLSVSCIVRIEIDKAIQLNKITKVLLGCDKAAVVEILTHRDATQRALIQKAYLAMYSDDILKRLPLELSGNLETSVLLWMPDPVERDLQVVKQGLRLETENLQAATEVICSRTPSQIQSFKQQYHSRFGVLLEHDIEMQASGDHKVGVHIVLMPCRLLCVDMECDHIYLYVTATLYWLDDLAPCLARKGCSERLNSVRFHITYIVLVCLEFDREIAVKDSKALFKAGEKKLGNDEKTFIHIFSERSRAQLAAIIFACHDMYGNSLKKNPARYFAKVLLKAMKGLGTDDTTLIRVIVTRTEIDMQYIKAEYLRKYNKTLYDAVHLETSGHYRTFLLSLLGSNH
ncbi:hypothetical protein RGQ29_003154 [Quercus rubra]|uniref:Annexin n=1 Tax=Quercus rubra TaxID=3512 RepID=A0AAN7EC35_QUERU|nr:hypothetical protein RGQ29_003154 [Quercus rubra]